MSRSLHKVNTTARMPFALFNSSDAAVTTAVDGDFTKVLIKDGASSAVTVTISHVTTGVYEATFTPTGTGVWYLNARHSTHAPRGFQHSWDVTTDGIISLSDITSAVPTANANADALLDRANGVETGVTVRQTLQRMGATTAGECTVSADGLTNTFKGLDDSTTRVVATVDPDTGDRSVVTYS